MAYTVGMDTKTYTLKEAAELLHLSKSGIRQRIKKLEVENRLIRESGPQGRLMIPDTLMVVLDTEHLLCGDRTKNVFSDRKDVDTDRFITGDSYTEPGDRIQPNTVQVPGDYPEEYAVMLNRLSDLAQSVTTMQETISKQQDMVNRMFESLEERDKRIQDLTEKNRQLEEAAKQSQEQTDTKAVPIDPDESQGHAPWWKRWFT